MREPTRDHPAPACGLRAWRGLTPPSAAASSLTYRFHSLSPRVEESMRSVAPGSARVPAWSSGSRARFCADLRIRGHFQFLAPGEPQMPAGRPSGYPRGTANACRATLWLPARNRKCLPTPLRVTHTEPQMPVKRPSGYPREPRIENDLARAVPRGTCPQAPVPSPVPAEPPDRDGQGGGARRGGPPPRPQAAGRAGWLPGHSLRGHS